MDMLERFKAIFMSPSGLFNGIKSEKEYNPTLMYFLVFVLGLNIISFVISLLAGTALMVQNTIVGWITSIISIFVFAFFLGLVASWFGGSRSWVQGLKVAVYPTTILAVFGFVITIIGAIFKSANVDLSNPQVILANLGAFVGVGIVIVLIALGALIWAIVLYVKGTIISHNLSGGKAFVTLVIAAIFTLIVMSIVDWMLSAVGLLTPIALPAV